jgi:hypothetical protein
MSDRNIYIYTHTHTHTHILVWVVEEGDEGLLCRDVLEERGEEGLCVCVCEK